MIDYGHFCLLIFAQGTWKENFKKILSKKVKNDFLVRMDLDENDAWGEFEVIPLFNPKNPSENEKACKLCHSLYDIFSEKLGQNDGHILFSHNTIALINIKHFANNLLSNEKIKKIYILELGFESYLTSTWKIAPKIIKELKHKCLKRDEFGRNIDNNKFQFGVIYEILKY